MRKLVFESLDELFESKKAQETEKEDKPKAANIAKEKAKVEKTKPTKLKKQPKEEKYEQAIKGLETQLAKVKKPGAMRQTPSQKKVAIEEVQKKLDAWKKKLADLKKEK